MDGSTGHHMRQLIHVCELRVSSSKVVSLSAIGSHSYVNRDQVYLFAETILASLSFDTTKSTKDKIDVDIPLIHAPHVHTLLSMVRHTVCCNPIVDPTSLIT
jgi:hypothetical protein